MKFRPDIEGLRAVAVLAVRLFHAHIPGANGGFVGVDVFFVISGFLITGLLWREARSTGSVRLRKFYGARARRLLPASALVIVVTLVASAVLLPPLRVPTVIYDGIASALYVGNYWLIIGDVNYFADLLTPSPFEHYWSLGVEEQFYLIWPMLILATASVVRRARRRSRTGATTSQTPYLVVLALIAAVSFTLSLGLTYVAAPAAYFSLPTRAWELAAGGLVALTATRWQRLSPRVAAVAGWAGLGAIVLACVQLTSHTPYPGAAALLPVVGAALVIAAGCATPSQGSGRLLGLPPMRAMGRISYSWYLWHWPVLLLTPLLVGHSLGLTARVAAILVSAGLAALTLWLVENPLRFAPAVRDSPRRSLGLGAAATAVAVSVGIALLSVLPNPIGRGVPVASATISVAAVPAGSGVGAYDTAVHAAFAQAQAAVAASVGIQAVPSNLQPRLAEKGAEQQDPYLGGCLRTPYQSGHPECATGDTSSPTTVALFGDSHAAMWNPAFQELAAQRHWRLETLAKGACPPVAVRADTFFHRLLEQAQHCEQWRAEVLARLRAERPRLVVISMWRAYGSDESLSGFTPFDPGWITSLTRLVQQLRDNGTEVLVLGPIPAPHQSIPVCVSGHLDDATACTLSRSTAVNQSGINAEAAATEAGGGHYVDVTDLFCTTDLCPAIVGNTLVYQDVAHMTREYSRHVAPVMGALADRALAQAYR
ncbi:acyltransferase family protein [Mycobacterium sp. ELW1]|nr:acyltransferase family protein [Mycobacterium sp. ELW1]QEN17088.1 acyltransferase [Mycobacterium sp. ELW1]